MSSPHLSFDLPSLERVIDRSPLTVPGDALVLDVITLMSQGQAGGESTTPEPRFFSDLPSQDLYDQNLPRQQRHSCVLVLDETQLVGIFTERDVVKLTASGFDLSGVRVAEVMTQNPITLMLTESQTALTAATLFRQHPIRHLPIVDDHHQLVGLVTPHSIRQVLDPLDIANIVETLHHTIEERTSELQKVNQRLEQEIAERQEIESTLQEQQQRLQAFTEQLEQQVADRTNDLAQANISLQESEHRYKSLVEASPVGIFWLDAAGQCTYVNNRWCEMSGRSAETAMGTEWLQTIHPDDQEATMQNWEQWAQAGEQGTPYQQEARLVRPDGSFIWFYCLVLRDVDANGSLLGYVGSITNITKRKQAESALQQQIQHEQLLSKVSQYIRQSLDLNEVLSRTVEQVRTVLKTDRAFIYHFQSDWRGIVVNESVGDDYPPALQTEIEDLYFMETHGEDYRQGRIQVVADVHRANLTQCHLEMLTQFQIKANLVVPILQDERLWGLLVTNQCSAPREWQPSEIELLKQLSNQLSIAIQQSELYEQTRAELFERQRVQAVLEASEERFRTLSTAAPIGICQTNGDGLCLYTNARWQEMSGLSLTDSLGRSWLQIIHPQDREAFSRSWNAHPQGEQDFLNDGRLSTPNGEIRWISTRVAPMKSFTDEIIGYVCTIEDITDRKLAELKIQEQAALLDIASDAIFVRDLDHHILYWNQGAERLYGWTAAEAIGQKADVLLQEDAAQIISMLQAVLNQDEWQGEIRKVTKTGKPVLIEGHWTLVRHESGNPKYILAVNTDITEKKQLEAQLLRAQRLESIGTLAGGIAHDLNNMLTPILVSAQLLQMQSPEARQKELLQMVESNARRGADLIKQVLTFARGTESKRIPLQPRHILAEVKQVCDHTFPKAITIALDLPANLAMTSADPTQLQQVLMNLCVNARDAMPQGGQLRLGAENFVADETYTRMNPAVQPGYYVMITIADTGTGMSPELLDRIFDPFFTTKAVGEGTGLGLSVVQGIIRSHDGFMTVDSTVDEGTQFKLYLPAVKTLAPSEIPQTADLPSGQGELILVVDDEENLRNITKTVLEAHNYQVLTASDGIEALILYAQHHDKIRAVLMDMMMPEMGGQTAIVNLKKWDPKVKIIVSSGLPLSQLGDLSQGIAANLPKPYTAQELLIVLHRVLSADNP